MTGRENSAGDPAGGADGVDRTRREGAPAGLVREGRVRGALRGTRGTMTPATAQPGTLGLPPGLAPLLIRVKSQTPASPASRGRLPAAQPQPRLLRRLHSSRARASGGSESPPARPRPRPRPRHRPRPPRTQTRTRARTLTTAPLPPSSRHPGPRPDPRRTCAVDPRPHPSLSRPPGDPRPAPEAVA